MENNNGYTDVTLNVLFDLIGVICKIERLCQFNFRIRQNQFSTQLQETKRWKKSVLSYQTAQITRDHFEKACCSEGDQLTGGHFHAVLGKVHTNWKWIV